jgi:uncharacterized protein (UPF0333 family)
MTIKGQAKLEYLLAMAAILLAILFAVRPGGPIQSAIGSVMNNAASKIRTTVNDAGSRLKM